MHFIELNNAAAKQSQENLKTNLLRIKAAGSSCERPGVWWEEEKDGWLVKRARCDSPVLADFSHAGALVLFAQSDEVHLCFQRHEEGAAVGNVQVEPQPCGDSGDVSDAEMQQRLLLSHLKNCSLPLHSSLLSPPFSTTTFYFVGQERATERRKDHKELWTEGETVGDAGNLHPERPSDISRGPGSVTSRFPPAHCSVQLNFTKPAVIWFMPTHHKATAECQTCTGEAACHLCHFCRCSVSRYCVTNADYIGCNFI